MANGAIARRLGRLARERKAGKQAQSFVGFSKRQVILGYAADMRYAKAIASVGYQHKAAKLINRTDDRGNCLLLKECDKHSNLRLKRRSKLSVSGSTVTRLSSAGFVLAEPKDRTVTVERTKAAKTTKPKATKRSKVLATKPKATKEAHRGAVLNAHELEFAAKQRRISGHKLDTY